MTALIFIGLIGLLLIFFGAMVGAQLQDQLHEQQRRRLAARRRELDGLTWRAAARSADRQERRG